MQILTSKDLDSTAQTITQRNYNQKPNTIADVLLISFDNHIEEDGDFSEIFRFTPQGTITSIPDFKLAQLNRTKILPGMTKAWHLHMKQDVFWYVNPSEYLIAGLWDIRKSSKTKGNKVRIALGNGKSQLLYIPKGVAHGSANRSDTPVNLLYGTTLQFNKKDPDEYRIPSDSSENSFWMPLKD